MTKTAYELAVDAIREDLAGAVDRHWPALAAGLAQEDDVDLVALDEMGASFPAAWVMVMVGASISNPDAPTTAIRVAPSGQLSFTTIGMLYDNVQGMVS